MLSCRNPRLVSFRAGLTRIFCALLILLAMPPVQAQSSSSEALYTLGVVPQFEQRKLFAVWKPIVEAMSAHSGYRLKLVATQSVPEFEQALARGEFDLVYTNPYQIMRESSGQGYIPLVRDRTPLRGIIVVARDSAFNAPGELNGQRLAIPSFNALGASLLVRADLERLFGAKVEAVNVSTHSSVYLQVANGLIPAGGGVQKTLSEQPAAVRDLLRVLYTTREMPSHPVSAHPRVPEAVRAALQAAMLDMSSGDPGRELLSRIPMQDAVAASIEDYLPMREWGLDAYWVD